MTALQICKAALEEIGARKCQSPAHCNEQRRCVFCRARAALEAAAKVGGLADDEALIERPMRVSVNGLTMHLAREEAKCILASIDAYLWGAR